MERQPHELLLDAPFQTYISVNIVPTTAEITYMPISKVLAFVYLLLIGLTNFVTSANAVTYYVATNGRDSNSGSKQNPWLTIGHAASKAISGDTVRVQPGIYDERVPITKSGTGEAWINFVADGQVVSFGFDLIGANYVRLTGFEIRHTSLKYKRAITLSGTCSHIDVIDNYIHDINGTGIMAAVGSTTSYVTIRGNTLYYMAHVPGETITGGAVGISSFYITSDHWLIEYNTISRSPDFIVSFGSNMIVRNNFLHDYADAYWANAPDAIHSDMFQCGSDGVAVGTRNQLYENNFTGDSIETNSHFGLWQDTVAAGDRNILIRGNIAFNLGSGGIGVISTKHVATYHNTFYKVNQKAASGAVLNWYNSKTGTDYSTDNLGANTLIYDDGNGKDALTASNGSTATLTHNLGYLAGTESSYVSTNDPLFVNASAHNFRLQANSPAINTGIHVVSITSANGSGTTFNVNDGLLLNDGWGISDGDTVTIAGKTTRITNISGNAVTVADSVTWTNGTPVYWGNDSTPDIGALPYGSAALTSAILSQDGANYTVTLTGDARGVWFYVNGIPSIWISKPPFTTTITDGTVSAKAFALYAQSTPVITAVSSKAPLAPSNLQIQSPR